MDKGLLELRDAKAAEAKGIAKKAQEQGESLTDEQVETINALVSEVKGLDERIENAKSVEEKLSSIDFVAKKEQEGNTVDTLAPSLGEHFVKSAGDQLSRLKGTSQRVSIGAPEFVKAAGDAHATTENPAIPAQVDQTVVHGFRERPTIAGWLSTGSLTSTSIAYYVEKLREGDFGAVAEGGLKPSLHYTYDQVVDSLTKIAGVIKINDEMFEDLPFLVSEINNRLLYDLVMFEEDQVLNGDGNGPNLTGLLNREGVQSVANDGNGAEALFKAITAVQTASSLTADGIVINPVDYQNLRLSKDSNGQYFAGGPFTGAYGNAGTQAPGVWGLNTIVTSAIPAGTALVGAGKQGATVYRKGGVRVEATNSNEDDFVHNRVTVRAEERVALAVRRPSAFVKVTGLGDA